MENKHVGFLVIGIAVLLVIIVLLYQSALKEIVVVSCGAEHATVCPMNDNINQQTYLSLAIVGILIVIGFVLISTKPKEKIIIKKVKERKKKIDLSKLDKNEKKIIDLLLKENKAMINATLKEK